jgi:hypothetical protein
MLLKQVGQQRRRCGERRQRRGDANRIAAGGAEKDWFSSLTEAAPS